jgi:hypothetical protein
VGEAVDTYLDVRALRQQAVVICEAAHRAAQEAERASRWALGQQRAITLWRDLFGEDYPAYG